MMKKDEFIALLKGEIDVLEYNKEPYELPSLPKFDDILYTNDTDKLFQYIKRDIKLMNGNPPADKLIKISVLTGGSINITSFKHKNGQFEQDAFERNLIINEDSRKPEILNDPRIVIIVNFERLPINTKRYLAFEYTSEKKFSAGNSKELNELGFIRTKNDILVCIVDSSKGGRANLDPGTANRFSHVFIYC